MSGLGGWAFASGRTLYRVEGARPGRESKKRSIKRPSQHFNRQTQSDSFSHYHTQPTHPLNHSLLINHVPFS